MKIKVLVKTTANVSTHTVGTTLTSHGLLSTTGGRGEARRAHRSVAQAPGICHLHGDDKGGDQTNKDDKPI